MKSRGESRIMTRIKNHRVESRITKWNQESPSGIKNHNRFQNHHRNLGLFCLYILVIFSILVGFFGGHVAAAKFERVKLEVQLQ